MMNTRSVILLFVIAVLVAGCKTQYVSVPEFHTDTLWQYLSLRDSVYLHDSTIVKERGDTVVIERWHTRWHDRFITDTIYRSRRDSISVPYPIERKLTKWESFCIDYGKVMTGVTIGSLVLILLFIIIWLRHNGRI